MNAVANKQTEIRKPERALGRTGEVSPRSLGIVPRDLDTPTAATEATVMTSFRGGLEEEKEEQRGKETEESARCI